MFGIVDVHVEWIEVKCKVALKNEAGLHALDILDKVGLAQRCIYALPLISVGAVCVAYICKSRIEFKEKGHAYECMCIELQLVYILYISVCIYDNINI